MTNSSELYQQATQYIPGGVNSPVRAFNGVGGDPLFVQSGQGAYITDADGKRYIDYVCSWGPLILGHAHPEVVKAVQEALEQGMSFGAPTEREILLANKINDFIPSMEMVRMVNSGTEAAMTAIRLARGFTGRDKMIKFAGCYHGHSDSLLVNAGSGALTFGVPSSPGVPAAVAADTLVADFNDLESVAALFEKNPNDIACVIIEPVAGNMNCIPPVPGFLEGLRDLCDRHQAVLVFDEVITGFRVAKGGAQALYGVTPDLTILGKIIGGGMPVGAFGGKREIMEKLAPLGPVYQAGTLSGNPLAMAAGLANLEVIESIPNFYETLTRNTQTLMTGITARAEQAGLSVHTQAVGAMFGVFFTEGTELDAITTLDHVQACNIELFKRYFHAMLQEGIYLAPSAYEVGFLSYAHQAEEIQITLDAVEKVFADISVKAV